MSGDYEKMRKSFLKKWDSPKTKKEIGSVFGKEPFQKRKDFFKIK